MSSLAAAKADNFYFPPDFDPKKHQSLNKYHGQHPLRERAAKLDQGILVIRFEVPFNIWCEKCGEHIAKGERFNAEKKAIGQYHSTKILQFCMAHHCGCRITIQTDPKNAEYLVVEGARKKVETYAAADAEVIELPDEAERERRRADPLYRLEYQQGAKAAALSGAQRLAAIQDAADERHADAYALNKALRAALRADKRAAAAGEAQRRALGLHADVALLPAAEGDGLAAAIAFRHSSAKADMGAEASRKRILEQDIFASRAAQAQGQEHGRSGSSAKAGSSGGGGGGGAAAAAAATGPSGQGLAAANGQPAASGQPAVKRQAVAAPDGRRGPVAAAPAGGAAAGLGSAAGGGGGGGAAQPPGSQRAAGGGGNTGGPLRDGPDGTGHGGSVHARPSYAQVVAGQAAAAAAQPAGRTPATQAPAAGQPGGPAGASGGRPPPGAAALAAAAALARSRSAGQLQGFAHAPATGPKAVPGGGGGVLSGGGGGGGGALAAAAPKRSLKDRAAALSKRRAGGGVGLTL